MICKGKRTSWTKWRVDGIDNTDDVVNISEEEEIDEDISETHSNYVIPKIADKPAKYNLRACTRIGSWIMHLM